MADWRIFGVAAVASSAAIAIASVAEPSSNPLIRPEISESGHQVNDGIVSNASEPLFPDSLRRFDMICRTEGRALGHGPGDPSGSDSELSDSWVSEFRESVNLDLRQSCTTPCDDGARNAVAPFDADRIIWSDTAGYARWVRRSDGRYMRRVEADGGIDEEAGYCRPWAFTDFAAAYVTTLPPKPGAEKLGLVIDYALAPGAPDHSADAPAFPVGLRRFDVFCAVRSVERESTWWPIEEAPGVVDDYWIGDLRLVIDLDAGRSCLVGCDDGPMNRPVTADAERITFRGHPGITSWLDRITGDYHSRRENYGRVETATGYCRPQPFSQPDDKS